MSRRQKLILFFLLAFLSVGGLVIFQHISLAMRNLIFDVSVILFVVLLLLMLINTAFSLAKTGECMFKAARTADNKICLIFMMLFLLPAFGFGGYEIFTGNMLLFWEWPAGLIFFLFAGICLLAWLLNTRIYENGIIPAGNTFISWEKIYSFSWMQSENRLVLYVDSFLPLDSRVKFLVVPVDRGKLFRLLLEQVPLALVEVDCELDSMSSAVQFLNWILFCGKPGTGIKIKSEAGEIKLEPGGKVYPGEEPSGFSPEIQKEIRKIFYDVAGFIPGESAPGEKTIEFTRLENPFEPETRVELSTRFVLSREGESETLSFVIDRREDS